MINSALSLGLMSGTSADGLTIALCAISAKEIKVKSFCNYKYPPQLRQRILAAPKFNAKALSTLNFDLGRIWAKMVKRFFKDAGLSYSAVECIASHGQTIFHYPKAPRHTMQIGEASFIAEETGLPIICDFRPRDIAAGGQGAPLISFLDEFLYSHSSFPVSLQNIGGIGNISFIGGGIKPISFDTGPGNSLMDTAVAIFTKGAYNYDYNGRYAKCGKIDKNKVESLLRANYFKLCPPKTLDRNSFSAAFLKANFPALNENNFCDIMATLNFFTASSILSAVKRFAPKKIRKLIVSGGGALNPVLMANLSSLFAPLGISVKSSISCGIAPMAKEAACFALMGIMALKGLYNHCPSSTGALGKRVLGKIIPGFRGLKG